MLKFVGNYDISIKIEKATLDLNKKFIKKFTKWFVSFYTLNQIVKVAKQLILKNHYQGELLKNQENNKGRDIVIENHRDSVIPKRLKIQIQDGIDLSIADECRGLSMFLDNARKQEGHRR